MTQTLVKKNGQQLARPIKILVPLIRTEIQLGDKAGLKHYIKAGKLLIEAKAQMKHGQFEAWSTRTFKRSKTTLTNWMRAGKSPARRTFETTLSEAVGDKRPKHHRPAWHEPVKEILDDTAADRFFDRFKAQKEEDTLIRELARKIIEAGFKVLSMKLHPDQGGNPDSFRRLTEAREMLRGCV
jgi:hypothetical protein